MTKELDILYDTIQQEKERCQLDGTGSDFDEGYYHGLDQSLKFIEARRKETKWK